MAKERLAYDDFDVVLREFVDTKSEEQKCEEIYRINWKIVLASGGRTHGIRTKRDRSQGFSESTFLSIIVEA